ncbi:MAG: bifunctional DNA primase/helicase [Chitinophagaceae bacterium]
MSTRELLANLGIDLKGKTHGQIKTLCPSCSATRRNKKELCLSVNIDDGVYSCKNGCGFEGRVFEKTVKEFVLPQARLEKVSTKTIDWFSKRKISNDTLLRFKITESREWMPQFEKEVPVMCFNYYRKEALVNIKFRGPEKSFKMEKDAELIFYNLDAIEGEDSCIIVEGEIDALTLHECKIYNVVSVPNGASKGNQKLEYLDNCWEYFQKMKKVIIATDDDEPGLMLREELARRIGKDKCWIIDYPPEAIVTDLKANIVRPCKDPNEVLVHKGSVEVVMMFENARMWPLEGIKTMDEMFPTIIEWYEKGYPPGTKAHINGLDHLLRFGPGQVTTFTGIPGHGKDEYANWIMASLAKYADWKWGICGFEESPEETTTKLIEKAMGRSFNFRKYNEERVSEPERDQGIAFVDKFFMFYNTDEISTDIDNLLDMAVMLVKRFGIKGLYINPWNWIEHNRPAFMSETEYVSLLYTKIIRFAKRWGVHVFIIAHTTKIQKDKQTKKYAVPTLYDISGSANFFNKTHNGITVYRHYDSDLVDVYVQKVKQSWMGQIGFSTYHYSTNTRQYSFSTSSVDDKGAMVRELKANLGGSWRPVDGQQDLPFEKE